MPDLIATTNYWGERGGGFSPRSGGGPEINCLNLLEIKKSFKGVILRLTTL